MADTVTDIPGATGRVRASAADETPVYVPSGAEHLFGVLTRPLGTPNGTAVLCVHAGAQNMSSHRNGVYTRLCRELAGLGYLTFRMDFHGSGDSSGRLANREVGGQTSKDMDAAVSWLLDQGAERVALVGTCWGGLVALVAAARLDTVVGAYLVSPPLRVLETGATKADAAGGGSLDTRTKAALVFQTRTARKLLTKPEYRSFVVARAKRRANKIIDKRLRRPAATSNPTTQPMGNTLFGSLVRRKVPVHVLFGEHERSYRELMKTGTLPSLDAAKHILDISATPVSVHGLASIEAQELVLAHVHRWLEADRAAAVAAPHP